MIGVRDGVLFDVDGTLLLGSVGHLVVLAGTLSRHLGHEVSIHLEGERPMLGDTSLAGWIDVQVVRAVLRAETGDAPEPKVAAVMADFERDYELAAAHRHATTSVVAGAPEALERLRAAGIRMGLVTGNASFVARAKFAAAGLDGFFRFERDLGFGDWRADRAEAARAAVAALAGDGDVSSLSMVGDTPLDMRAARAAGVRAIGVLTGTSTADQLLAAGADVVVASVADLFPADTAEGR